MRTSTKALLVSIGTLVLTALRHVYGAAIYATPWRHHVAVIAVPVLVVLILAHGVHRWRPWSALGRISLGVFIVVVALVPVGAIGILEGAVGRWRRRDLGGVA